MLDSLKERGFQIDFHSHAAAILDLDFPEALSELEWALSDVWLPIEEIIGSGGGETKWTQRLRNRFAEKGWVKTNFRLEKSINGIPRESISHEIDHVRTLEKGVLALEIEWNNKDPFYDRDLENFKRLHAEGAISVGMIVTRGASLQAEMIGFVERFARERQLQSQADLQAIGLNPTIRQQRDVERRMAAGLSFSEAWSQSFVSDKYGQATTHWRKLDDRVRRGVGNPCPMVLVGLPASIVRFGGEEDLRDIAANSGPGPYD